MAGPVVAERAETPSAEGGDDLRVVVSGALTIMRFMDFVKFDVTDSSGLPTPNE